jgi:hypothetical protein
MNPPCPPFECAHMWYVALLPLVSLGLTLKSGIKKLLLTEKEVSLPIFTSV